MMFRLPGLPLVAILVLCLVGCHTSSRIRTTEDPDADADADADGDIDEDPLSGLCAPQVAHNDPDVMCDCYFCDDPTPYLWNGDDCVFSPICCYCLGADCEDRFGTYEECISSYQDCPQSPPEARFPNARLIWQSAAGFAGSGPLLMIDGGGFLRFWDTVLESGSWEMTGWSHAEQFDMSSVNDLFESLASVDYERLPHPPTNVGECYSSMDLTLCAECEAIRLQYNGADDLRPEFAAIYAWFQGRLCAMDFSMLPDQYCWGMPVDS